MEKIYKTRTEKRKEEKGIETKTRKFPNKTETTAKLRREWTKSVDFPNLSKSVIRESKFKIQNFILNY